MKHFLIFILIMLATPSKAQLLKPVTADDQRYLDSLNRLRLGVNMKPTRYKPGFRYTLDGDTYTLSRWKLSHTDFVTGVKIYRWEVYRTPRNRSVIVIHWTDDEWIDVATGKAYLDTEKHKIVYYKN